jgi:hypothetical protein
VAITSLLRQRDTTHATIRLEPTAHRGTGVRDLPAPSMRCFVLI